MALNPGLELPFGIQPTNPVPVDAYKGPYASVAEANASIPLAVRYQGQEVIIITGGRAEKYTYEEGTANGNLVPFSAGTVYTFENGLTETGGVVRLGGVLTTTVNINPDIYYINIGREDFSDTGIVVGDNIGSTIVQIYTVFASLQFFAGTITVVGTPVNYDADYSSSYTARSIPDVGYVQSLIPTAAGANTQVQFNNAGAFGASANFTYSTVSNELTVGKLLLTAAGGIEFSFTDAIITAAENIAFESNLINSVYSIGANFNVDITALAGVGTRMVVADASGRLSTQAIPTASGTVTSVNVSGGTTGLSFSGGPVTDSGTITMAGTLAVANGGTGQTSFTNGQLLIGNTTGGTLVKATLTGTANQVTVTNGAGSITLALPQNIHTAATPTFAGLTASNINWNSSLSNGVSFGLSVQNQVGAVKRLSYSNNGDLLLRHEQGNSTITMFSFSDIATDVSTITFRKFRENGSGSLSGDLLAQFELSGDGGSANTKPFIRATARDTFSAGVRTFDLQFLTGLDATNPTVLTLGPGLAIGFYGAAAIAKPTVSGSRGGNAALASLLTQLANLGLVTDSTTA